MARCTPFCTNNEVRKHFIDCGITYSDITEGDILALVLRLNQEIKKSNQTGETSVNTMRLSKRISIKTNPNGSILSCFLYMSSHYFEDRECVSFNRDGYIGIAGWADDGNSNPIRRALLAWCDDLKNQKEDSVMAKQSFQEGQYIIYQNGDRYEIGKIKRIVSDGAFVFYSSGDTAAKTPFACMHPIVNEYVIGETSLGGSMV